MQKATLEKVIHQSKCKKSLHQKVHNVIAGGINHQCEQQHKPGYLCVFHEFVARFSSEQHFIKQEHHMTAIQSRNRQHVHKGKNDGDEGSGCLKDLPIPFSRE